MSRRALLAGMALVAAAFPALAYEIKPKAPETAFSAKLVPDIVGLSSHVDADKARALYESYVKDLPGVKPQTVERKFGSTNVGYVTAMTFDKPKTADHPGESLASHFSSPASGNFAYLIVRHLGFAKASQPAKAEMIAHVTGKYGKPTVIGDGHLYYFYRKGKIVSVKQKYTPASALEALNAPVNPKAAVALNDANGRGSCIAVLKHVEAMADKSLDALLTEAKAAHCDGLLDVTLAAGDAPDRVSKAIFTLIDFKRIISADRIDDEAFAAERNAAMKKTQSGNAPKL
ncbi:hypothetical protein ACSVBT_07520 [Afipia sp. TerB]